MGSRIGRTGRRVGHGGRHDEHANYERVTREPDDECNDVERDEHVVANGGDVDHDSADDDDDNQHDDVEFFGESANE